ncbi:class I SAM-dependent methyltransferase [Leifsonia sp. McL0607]|uniref:class I SAM-dependent methyltransferase n=1 Tax=Leifsonia sp. McL0607 TaxID=3415672 RepID=UPI003CFA1241
MTDDLLSAVRARFDGRAGEYDGSAMHRQLATAVAAFALEEGQSASDVLDVGTGTGLVLRALHDRDPSLRLTGIDLSHGMLEVARTALPGAALVEGDATVLPFGDAEFDLVTCATSLHLFPDVRAAIAEWVRVLRPGGRVVTATFGDIDLSQHGGPPGAAVPQVGQGAGQSAGHHGATASPYPTHHELFRTPELLAEAVAPAGLELRRHAWWTHSDDRILLAELQPTASTR